MMNGSNLNKNEFRSNSLFSEIRSFACCMILEFIPYNNLYLESLLLFNGDVWPNLLV